MFVEIFNAPPSWILILIGLIITLAIAYLLWKENKHMKANKEKSEILLAVGKLSELVITNKDEILKRISILETHTITCDSGISSALEDNKENITLLQEDVSTLSNKLAGFLHTYSERR